MNIRPLTSADLLNHDPDPEVVVVDVETTGMSPQQGARVTEVGAVIIRDGQIVDRFQSLMNAGVTIPRQIVALTGIDNRMRRQAPPSEQVLPRLADFIGERPWVAHNATFDQRFLVAELDRVDRALPTRLACSLRLARRLFPEAPGHGLGRLVAHLELPHDGSFHRALSDATMTAQLWFAMQRRLREDWRLPAAPFALLYTLQRLPCQGIAAFLKPLSRP